MNSRIPSRLRWGDTSPFGESLTRIFRNLDGILAFHDGARLVLLNERDLFGANSVQFVHEAIDLVICRLKLTVGRDALLGCSGGCALLDQGVHPIYELDYLVVLCLVSHLREIDPANR